MTIHSWGKTKRTPYNKNTGHGGGGQTESSRMNKKKNIRGKGTGGLGPIGNCGGGPDNRNYLLVFVSRNQTRNKGCREGFVGRKTKNDEKGHEEERPKLALKGEEENSTETMGAKKIRHAKSRQKKKGRRKGSN